MKAFCIYAFTFVALIFLNCSVLIAAPLKPVTKASAKHVESEICRSLSENVVANLKTIALRNVQSEMDNSAIRQTEASNEVNGMLNEIRENMQQMRDNGCGLFPYPIKQTLFAPAATQCVLDLSKAQLQMTLGNSKTLPAVSSCDQSKWEPGIAPAPADLPITNSTPVNTSSGRPSVLELLKMNMGKRAMDYDILEALRQCNELTKQMGYTDEGDIRNGSYNCAAQTLVTCIPKSNLDSTSEWSCIHKEISSIAADDFKKMTLISTPR